MKNPIFYFLFFSFAFTASTWADTACMKNAKTDEEINICQHAEAKQLELQLGELEGKIRARFKGVQLERFDAAQLAWQQMTAKDCEIEADFYEGAPVYPAIQSQCLKTHYLVRIENLSRYLCPEYSYTKGCGAQTKSSTQKP